MSMKKWYVDKPNIDKALYEGPQPLQTSSSAMAERPRETCFVFD